MIGYDNLQEVKFYDGQFTKKFDNIIIDLFHLGFFSYNISPVSLCGCH